MGLNTSQLATGGIIFILSWVSNSIGFSGMEVAIPALKIGLDMDHKYAVALAHPIQLFVMLVRFWYFSTKKTRFYGDISMIDVRFASVMVPLIIIGAVIGQELYYVGSRILETTLFVAWVFWITIRTIWTLKESINRPRVDPEAAYIEELYIEEGSEFRIDSSELLKSK